jgi:multicomponent Na+:H+ antiporter subunit D
MLVKAGLELEQYFIVAVALGVSILTLFSMIKIWDQAFWKNKPDPQTEERPVQPNTWWYHLAPILFLAILTVGIGLLAEPVFVLAMQAAEQLLDPANYIATVLGGSL